MEIVVNGEPREVPSGTSLAALLDELQVTARHVAVEVNLKLVPRGNHARYHLSPGDCLEVVTLVGGG